MDKKVSEAVMARAKELVAKAGSGFHVGMLAIQSDIVFDHRNYVLGWRACLGHFCGQGSTIGDALDSVEREIERDRK